MIIVFCIIYIFLAPYFFKFFFPKYLNAVSYSQLAIFYTLAGITYPFGSYLNAHRKVKESYAIAIINIIVKIITLAIFVPLYGVWGAILSILASSASNILTSFYILYKAERKEKFN